MRRRRRVLLAGERLGYPIAASLTGNLPVLSAAFHIADGAAAPTSADAAASEARAAYAHATGNLPVLSADLAPSPLGSELAPGWIRLSRPPGAHWNTYTRAFRESRPGPFDDGSAGAHRGERHLARAELQALRAAVLARADELPRESGAAGEADFARARRIARAYASLLGENAPPCLPPALTPLLLMSPADLHMRALAPGSSAPAPAPAPLPVGAAAAAAGGGGSGGSGGSSADASAAAPVVDRDALATFLLFLPTARTRSVRRRRWQRRLSRAATW